MAQNPTRWRVRARVAAFDRGGGDIPGLLDMLRYDGCTVHSWDHDDDAVLVTMNYAAGRLPMLPRWHSFGLYPKEVS